MFFRVLRDSSGVEATFKKFSHSCEHLKGTKHGHVYLTNFRVSINELLVPAQFFSFYVSWIFSVI